MQTTPLPKGDDLAVFLLRLIRFKIRPFRRLAQMSLRPVPVEAFFPTASALYKSHKHAFDIYHFNEYWFSFFLASRMRILHFGWPSWPPIDTPTQPPVPELQI
jgi:hypothetical protein